jgi:tetratricopeptide (TPR) repeat protein
LNALDVNSDAIAYATIQNAMNAVELAQTSDELQAILDANPGTSLADKVEDVLAKVQSATAELSKSPPDLQAVLGNIEGAVGDLEAAVKEGLDGAQGLHLSNLLSASARQFASGAINEAVAQNGNRGKIREAQRSLAEGDALRASGKFKDAVSKYKDALSKAPGARR